MGIARLTNNSQTTTMTVSCKAVRAGLSRAAAPSSGPTAPAAAGSGRGRPKEDREIKKQVRLPVLPSLYEDIRKIAYVQRRRISDVVGDLMEQFRVQLEKELAEYRKKVRKMAEATQSCLNVNRTWFTFNGILFKIRE